MPFAETGEASESNITFSQIEIKPTRISTYVDVSRLLIRQSSLDVERILVSDLMAQTGLQIQNQAVNGDGSGNNMTGIRNKTGINTVNFEATNGGPATRNKLIDFKAQLLVDEIITANSRLAFLVNGKTSTALEKIPLMGTTDTGSGKFLWEGMLNDPLMGTVVNAPAMISNVLSHTLSKGTNQNNLSSVIFADWSNLIVGMFGPMYDIILNPYTKGKSGLIEIITHSYVGVNLKRANAFTVSNDLIA